MTDDTFDWVGSIVTASGKAVNIIDFTPEMVDVADISQSISLICRYNGHVPYFYSVAEHSVRVAFWLRENGFSAEECLTGLLHDASEAYVGDMVRPLKRVEAVAGEHQKIESHISEVIHSVLGGTFPHPSCVHDADKAIYEWEVEHIRSAARRGWPPEDAKGKFLAALEFFQGVVNEERRSTNEQS